MLKTISPPDVCMGMFIQGLEGGWLSHPFWRSQFLVEDDETLAKLRGSRVRGVVIDEARGVGHGRPPEPAAPAGPDRMPRDGDAMRRRVARTDAVAAPPLSAAPSPDDRTVAARLAARGSEVTQRIFREAEAGRPLPIEVAEAMVADIATSISGNRTVLLAVTRLKERDLYTYGHCVAVSALMIALALGLDLPEAEARELGMAGLMHDVGKAYISLAILNKPGVLTDTERAIVDGHTARGHEMLIHSRVTSSAVLDVCRWHHATTDDAGRSLNEARDARTTAVQIAKICDIFDALTSARPYKTARSPIDAMTVMMTMPALDKRVLDVFMTVVGVYPLGAVVELNTGKLALVVPNSRRSNRPLVRVFFCLESDSLVPPHDVVLIDGGAEWIVRRVVEGMPQVRDWSALHARLMAQLPLAA